jgi:predicted DNA-binding transcriptional regulator YafY
MPRPERIFELYQLLAGRRPISVREIAERFEVSVRTAYRDLQLLEARHGAPIEFEDGGYRLMATATVRPVHLTRDEAALLRAALENTALRGRSALARRLRAIESKLAAAMRDGPTAGPPLALVPRDRTGPGADRVFEALESAVTGHRVCEASYEGLGGRGRRLRRLHPLRLFQRGDAWYLAAFAPEHGEVRTFRIDRFGEVRLLDETFVPPAGFDLEAYLAGAWEVFRGDTEIEAHVLFDASLAPLFLNARHHPNENVGLAKDGRVDYRVRVSHLDELARWIVGFGGMARVVSPKVLRAKVAEIGTASANAQDGRRVPPPLGAGSRQGSDSAP